MKSTNHHIIPSLIFSLIALAACGGNRQAAKKLYEQREFLLQEFKDKSIIKRGDNFFQLSYHKGQAVNTFFFEKKGNELVLTNDTLQYPIHEIAAFTSLSDTSRTTYGKAVSNELRRLLNETDRLEISNVSAEFAPVGVDMKIYFGDYKALLYVNDTANVKNERWKNYLSTGEKFDANWYYVKDEREK